LFGTVEQVEASPVAAGQPGSPNVHATLLKHHAAMIALPVRMAFAMQQATRHLTTCGPVQSSQRLNAMHHAIQCASATLVISPSARVVPGRFNSPEGRQRKVLGG
jgi:hypothetical protein